MPTHSLTIIGKRPPGVYGPCPHSAFFPRAAQAGMKVGRVEKEKTFGGTTCPSYRCIPPSKALLHASEACRRSPRTCPFFFFRKMGIWFARRCLDPRESMQKFFRTERRSDGKASRRGVPRFQEDQLDPFRASASASIVSAPPAIG